MAEQLTVRLPADLSRELAEAAGRMHRKRSEVIRLALRHYLDLVPGSDRPPAERVRHLIGALDSGVPDLAENHRKYLLESIRRGG
jgi:metal-responsive CopG/Arc/MetJ family transcriptional regulator